jgi:cytochrome c-type biogenesis protein CcmH
VTAFIILAAGLAGLALLFILPPMLGKRPGADSVSEDQINLAVFRQQLQELDADLAAGKLDRSQYDSARRDLEKELLHDIDETRSPAVPLKSGRWAAPVLALAVPLMALGMYLKVGNYSAIDRMAVDPATATPEGHGGDPNLPSMGVLVERLAERMKAHPDDLKGWMMLGRSCLALGKDKEAVDAFAQGYRLAPKDPDVMIGYAEALARAAKRLAGRPTELVEAAMQIDPGNPNGLWMMGLVEMQRGAPAKAVELWTKLAGRVSPGSSESKTLRRFIAAARRRAGMPPQPLMAAATQAEASAAASPPPTGGGKSIQVQVSLGAGMQGRFSPDDTLFVYAQALAGPPMPLAVKRLRAKDLPVTLALDDSMAMMPQMRLSNFPQVRVGARISKSGNAMSQSGDLQGEVSPVTPGQPGLVKVVIDNVQP